MHKKTFLWAVIACILLLASSCATIIHGSKQSIAISSSPTSAKVTVDSLEAGVTPVTVKLSRKDIHTVKLELEGYEPYEIILNRKVDAWIAGNIVFGGVIGLAVDAITGGMYKLSPEEIMAELKSATYTSQVAKGDVVVFVTMEPKAEWARIGNMKAN